MTGSIQYQKLVSSGATPISTTITLNPVDSSRISIQGELVTVDFSFTLKPSYVTYKSEKCCIVYMDIKGSDSSILYIPISGNTITFGLPSGGLSALNKMYIGYSNGVFGGCSRAYYFNSRSRMFNYYDTAVFDTGNMTYFGHGTSNQKVLVKYIATASNLIYIGHTEAIIGSFNIGGVI